MYRVMICEDIAYLCDQYRETLEKDGDFQVVASVHSGIEAVRKAAELRPDIIIMDIEMETAHAGIDASEKILKNNPQTRIIVLSMHSADELIFDAFAIGCVDYIIKNSDFSDLCTTVKNAINNNSPLSPLVATKLKREFRRIRNHDSNRLSILNNLFRLSKTELEILDLYLTGKTKEEICEQRFIELSTLKSQTHSILQKLEFNHVSSLVSTLQMFGLDTFIRNTLKVLR